MPETTADPTLAAVRSGDPTALDTLFREYQPGLARHAGKSVEGMRDGVLDDVKRWSGHAPHEDDQTILVLKVP